MSSSTSEGFQTPRGGNRRDEQGTRTVAIMGAGFAGLVLANYLEVQLRSKRSPDPREEQHGTKQDGATDRFRKKTRDNWTYELYESKPGSGIPVIGTICLESARRVLEELSLFEEACREESGTAPVFPKQSRYNDTATNTNTKNDNDDDTNNDYREVSRESFLELLRKNVTIQSSSRVVDVVEEPCGSGFGTPAYTVVTEDASSGGKSEHGPFDLVVAANGLSFGGQTAKALQEKLEASSSLVVRIGDLRYKHDRSWWDFDFLGANRRKRGADVAIRDGLLVGQRLFEIGGSLEEGQRFRGYDLGDGMENNNNATTTLLSEILSMPSQHCSYRGESTTPMRLFVVLLPIVMALVLALYH